MCKIAQVDRGPVPAPSSPPYTKNLPVNPGTTAPDAPQEPLPPGPVINCDGFTEPLDYNAQLSPNFKLRDLTIAIPPDRGIKKEIIAQGGFTPVQIACNLKEVAVNLLEPIRAKYPGFIITSGFRQTSSISISGRVSQHEKGQAADIQWPKPPTSWGAYHLEIANWIAANLPVDQIILEHSSSPRLWVHVSYVATGGRKSKLTMLKSNYEPGLKTYYA
jgi:zinc D-Ala-D-Ala carboxypeptidase